MIAHLPYFGVLARHVRATARPLRPLAVAIGLAAALAGCSLLPSSPTIALYQPQPTLPPGATATLSGSAGSPTQAAPTPVAWRLAIARPHSLGSLNSPRIQVMPRPGEIEVYPQAQWSDTPPAMLAEWMLRAFVQDGRILGVGRQAAGLGADYELTSDLQGFEVQVRNGVAYAVVRLQARLVEHPANRIVATRAFAVEAPAASQQVGDAVRAFDQAIGGLLPALTNWTLTQGEAHWAARPPTTRRSP